MPQLAGSIVPACHGAAWSCVSGEGSPSPPTLIVPGEVQMGRKQEKQQLDERGGIWRPGVDSDSLADLGKS